MVKILRIDCVEVVDKIASVPAVTKETKMSIIHADVSFLQYQKTIKKCVRCRNINVHKKLV